MRYISTRGHPDRKQFCDILREGLAPDGGLYVPEAYPRVDDTTLVRWRVLSYPELAFEILSLYIDDIPHADLKAICEKTYAPEIFGSRMIAPVRQLETGFHIRELSNGPTLAFKDMAMQLLGNLLEYELARRRGKVEHSRGDQWRHWQRGRICNARQEGCAGLYDVAPQTHERFQLAQMFSLQDDNIHNIAIEGVFDDCQDIVKSGSSDLEFKKRYKIGAINSINWARLVAQVVYYFSAYFQVTEERASEVDFTVPSGNFGNICAGHVARMMGLPISRLVIATNENDVLDEFFRTGEYRARGRTDTYETSCPSMDISKASILERFVFDLLGRDARRTKSLFDDQLRKCGSFDLCGDLAFAQAADRFGFRGGKSTHADRMETIRDTWHRFSTLIDPHLQMG